MIKTYNIKFDVLSSDRIDKIITNYFKINIFNFSRTKIQKLIKQKKVQVNNNIIKSNYFCKIGDKIIIKFSISRINKLKPLKKSLKILYEDNYLMIINKPNNLVVHPAPGHKNDTLVNILLTKGNQWSTVNGYIRPGIVHRIDKQTTGILILAKNNIIHNKLQQQIKTKKLKRYYLAIVHGKIIENKIKIDAPIGRDYNNRKKMTVTEKNSKKAITNIIVIKRFNDYTYIECELESGRTHQIRVHLKYINYPIVGDPLYGLISEKKENFGQYLHAYQLKFIHPITKKYLKITASLPNDFKQKLIKLQSVERIKK